MKAVLHVVLKLIGFCGIVLVLQTVIIRTNPPQLPQIVWHLLDVVQNDPDITYFGDSVTTVIHPADIERRPLWEIFRDSMPGRTFAHVTYSANTPDVYLSYGIFLKRMDRSVKRKILIIPINLRAFSPSWDQRPIFQFGKDTAFLRYYGTPIFPFLKILMVTNAFPVRPVSTESFGKIPVYNGSDVIGQVKDFESIGTFNEENLKRIITYFYMLEIQPDNRQLQAIMKLADVLKKSNYTPLFYLTPIDYQTGERYLGPQFVQRITGNAARITSGLMERGYEAVDLTQSLESSSFAWRGSEFSQFINEHLNSTGRMAVVRRLVEEIEKRTGFR